MSDTTILTFQQTVWNYFAEHGRHDLPWRQPDDDGSFDPYKICVSELMLQQTQVARVWPKYEQFLRAFPTVEVLAAAGLGDVLVVWQGLGYNRRAKFLWQAAQKVVQDFGGVFPSTPQELVRLPGIAANTAGAIMAYAYNQPIAFVETNVRTVYIHHFFKGQTDIPDSAILELVERTLPDKEGKRAAGDDGFTSSPRRMRNGVPAKPVLWGDSTAGLSHYREWYWALMDYGVFLKQTVGNLSRHSKSYAKQSKFVGSNRQIRGQIIRLLAHKPCTLAELESEITDGRLANILNDLKQEGLIAQQAGIYSLFAA